jgi:hypothetical protein
MMEVNLLVKAQEPVSYSSKCRDSNCTPPRRPRQPLYRSLLCLLLDDRDEAAEWTLQGT